MTKFNKNRVNKLKTQLEKLERITLGNYPTPLHNADNLTKKLGGPRILFKREDLSGLAFGGNKTRMFEYSIARAIKNNCDCIIGGAAVQSNYCRQLAAACAKNSLKLYLVLRPVRGEKDYLSHGNLLLDYLLGAHVEIAKENSTEEQIEIARELENKLRKEGKNPHIFRDIDNSYIGLEACAYVSCFLEIIDQVQEEEINVDYIFVASEDTTQGGLIFGAEYIKSDIKIIGINPTRADALVKLRDMQKAISKEIKEEIDFNNAKTKIVNLTDYAGEGYGIPSKEGIEAIRIVAQSEGILLDPVYTGKAMAGLIDFVKKGKITKDDTVVFIHTGGNPALFAYDYIF